MDLRKKIDLAQNVEELLELLNGFICDENDDQDRLAHHVDLSGLPVFGNNLEDTLGAFSYDNDRLLIQGSVGFELIDRADFY